MVQPSPTSPTISSHSNLEAEAGTTFSFVASCYFAFCLKPVFRMDLSWSKGPVSWNFLLRFIVCIGVWTGVSPDLQGGTQRYEQNNSNTRSCDRREARLLSVDKALRDRQES